MHAAIPLDVPEMGETTVRRPERGPETTSASTSPLNRLVAERLREGAVLLEQQGASPFRVAAYRRAADTVAGLAEDVADLMGRKGVEGLEALPGIGRSIAAAVAQMVLTGRWPQLDRLRGAAAPERLFQSIPGLGPELARRIHDTLHVDSLEALETAAHDGRLEQVPGVGPRRAAMLRASLDRMLARTRRTRPPSPEEPAVGALLDVDREYRDLARRGALPKIAPRRFNPSGEAWLPVLHTERGPWSFTVLYSNTARAHELQRTDDWVVIYFHRDDAPEGLRTVVTETHGPLAGERVVRGREAECLKRMSDRESFIASGAGADRDPPRSA
jgi:putative hydrolase